MTFISFVKRCDNKINEIKFESRSSSRLVCARVWVRTIDQCDLSIDYTIYTTCYILHSKSNDVLIVGLLSNPISKICWIMFIDGARPTVYILHPIRRAVQRAGNRSGTKSSIMNPTQIQPVCLGGWPRNTGQVGLKCVHFVVVNKLA